MHIWSHCAANQMPPLDRQHGHWGVKGRLQSHLSGGPKFTRAGFLGPYYYRWYTILIKKIYRLSTGLSEPIRSPSPRIPPSFFKPYLDKWETDLLEWLGKSWITGLTDIQLEAIYSVLFNLAEDIFQLNAHPDGKQTCEGAVMTTVRLMNSMPRCRHVLVPEH